MTCQPDVILKYVQTSFIVSMIVYFRLFLRLISIQKFILRLTKMSTYLKFLILLPSGWPENFEGMLTSFPPYYVSNASWQVNDRSLIKSTHEARFFGMPKEVKIGDTCIRTHGSPIQVQSSIRINIMFNGTRTRTNTKVSI